MGMNVENSVKNFIAAKTSVGRILQSFLQWWFAELLTVVPQNLRAWMVRRARYLIVDVGDAEVSFTLCSEEGRQEIITLALTPTEDEKVLAAGLCRRSCQGSLEKVVVQIPKQMALRKTLNLPLATEENLREVLAFEMDRYSPFNIADVYYDYSILGRSTAQGTVQVFLTVVRRSEVDPVLDMLVSWGLEPTLLNLAGDNGQATVRDNSPYNLLPPERRVMQGGTKSMKSLSRVMLVAALLVIAVSLPFMQKNYQLKQLRQAVEETRREALQYEQIKEQLGQISAKSDFLINKRKKKPRAIEVLNEVTRVLPDTTWLNRFEISGGRVRVQGESTNASGLAARLEDSALFKVGSFDSPVTRNRNTEQERFVISATVREIVANGGAQETMPPNKTQEEIRQ